MASGKVKSVKGDSSANDLIFLKRKCASLMKELCDLEGHSSGEALKQLTEEELSVRLEILDGIKQNFEISQLKFEQLDMEQLESNARERFTSVFIRTKAFLIKELKTRSGLEHQAWPTPPNVQSTSFVMPQPRPRLPALQIPKFGGAYTEWPDFFSMFQTIVGNDPEVSRIEKFQHLRSNLKDTALEVIRSLEISAENYDKAISMLEKRFNNKRLNFQAHIQQLIGLKRCEVGSVHQLRALNDQFNAHFRALQTMASKEQIADGLLIHFIVNTFDVESQMKWEETTPTTELPTLESTLKFWDQRCQMLENVEHAMVMQTPSKQVSRKPITRKAFISLSQSTRCLFCNSIEHYIYRCKLFLNLSPDLRCKEAKKLQLCTNCLREGHFVKTCKSSCCRSCGLKHHTLLHSNARFKPSPEHNSVEIENIAESHQALVTSQAKGPNSFPDNVVLLATAVIFVKNRVGTLVPCRALLDSASQLNFVSSRCANMLQLKRSKSTTVISGIGQTDLVCNHSVEMFIKSRINDYSNSLVAVVTPSITDNQPNHTLENIDWQIPSNINLADPLFYRSQRVDILIGASLFFDLLCVGQIRLSDQLPLLQKTRLGWVVSGGALPKTRTSSCLTALKMCPLDNCSDLLLDEAVRQFWEVENISSAVSKISQEELDCENHFVTHCTRLPTGHFSVRLPFKVNASELGSSYQNALNRFTNLERKLNRNPDLKAQYSTFMTEYAQLGHMSTIETLPTNTPTFFLPHHCVLKADSSTTKLRVVFDGSARSSSGLSLNDVLMAGPTIQPSLFEILLRFRSHRVALTGDIEKMYRCVRVTPPDNFAQCILWREDRKQELKMFKLDTITYGTKPASFLAIRAMQQLAFEAQNSQPTGSTVILRDFYVDDLISGGDSEDEVQEVMKQTRDVLLQGNFKIRKWCSNNENVLAQVPQVDKESFLKFTGDASITKTLGLYWDPKIDDFLFFFKPHKTPSIVTRRSVLSVIARLYDPLGLVGPVIAKAKIFLQNLWRQQLHWDESLPQNLTSLWDVLMNELAIVEKCSFPRFVRNHKDQVELHAFCDASLLAYGACVYVTSRSENTFTSHLLCSKSRVAPLKGLTIPKLELCSALLLAELIEKVVNLRVFGAKIYCWSDSTIVLSWLKEPSTNFNVFVANRVKAIQTLTEGMVWNYVPSASNPADILSRGASPQELINSSIWMHGPEFLVRSSQSWPEQPEMVHDNCERRKQTFISTVSMVDLSITSKYANSFNKMQRIFAYVYKFLHRSPFKADNVGTLSTADIKHGTILLLRMIQRVHFAAEYKMLAGNKSISASSLLYSLNPFLDSERVIRVGGRLENSTLDFESKHPIILPKKHPITDAIIAFYHRKLLHAGAQSLLASIRLQYWPLGGKRTISRVLNKCVICFRARPRFSEQIMGNLPLDRVQANRAFVVTGVDFCGPFFYKAAVRNRPPTKCYVAVFICFATKAVHMDLVTDLSTSSFLAALKRFISLRGKPRTIWSDNATNFVGAKKELIELRTLFESCAHTEAIVQACLNDGIDWRFIPPRSPHFGGLWEAAVKSAKYHFRRTIGPSILSFDELRTLTYQISAILNSRPLTPISDNPDDIEVLTPAHFLIGAPFTSFVEPDITSINLDRLDRWQRVSQIQQTFWLKWSKEYLTSLQQRSKWRSSGEALAIGTLVLIKDNNVPPLKWQLARVVDVVKGDDNVSRVAILKTSTGISKRAIQNLCPLPLDINFERLHLPTGAGCSGPKEETKGLHA